MEDANCSPEDVNPLPEDEVLPESEVLLSEEYSSVLKEVTLEDYDVSLTDEDMMREVIQEISEEQEDQRILAAIQKKLEDPYKLAIEQIDLALAHLSNNAESRKVLETHIASLENDSDSSKDCKMEVDQTALLEITHKAMADGDASKQDASDARLAKAAADATNELGAAEEQRAFHDARETKAVEVVKRAEILAASIVESNPTAVAQKPAQTAETWKPRADHFFRTRTPEASTSRHYQHSPSQTKQDYNTHRPGRHCFLHFACMAARKCRWCWQPIKLLRGAAKCQKCGIIVHKICQGIVFQSCGFPEDLWTNYAFVKSDQNPGTRVIDLENVVCWVYLHLTGLRQLRYLRFLRKTIYLHTEEPTDNTPIEEFYPLGLPGLHTQLITDVSGRYHGPNLDRFIAVYFYSDKNSAIPSTTFMLEFPADWDREVFIDAYDLQISH